VSLSWLFIVDLTPTNKRPYVGSTQNNSAIELAYSYNGSQRLFNQNNNEDLNFGGKPGILRLWNEANGGQIGWFLGLSLISILILLRKEKITNSLTKTQSAGIYFGTWLITGTIIFSYASFMHPYYTATLTPAISILLGLTIPLTYQAYKNNDKRKYIFLILIFFSIIEQSLVLLSFWQILGKKYLFPFLLLALLIILTINLLSKKQIINKFLYLFALAFLFAISACPIMWISYSIKNGINQIYPSAGYNRTNIVNKNDTRIQNTENKKVLDFLIKNKINEKYIVATTNSLSSDYFIISNGMPVLSIGGFSNTYSTISFEIFKQFINDGKIRFVYLKKMTINNTEINKIIDWTKTSCKTLVDYNNLYDCKNI